MLLTPNAVLENKYAPGNRVWIVFSIGPNIKINEFEIKAMVSEFVDNKMTYLYGYNADGDGKEGGLNLSFARESMCFFNKKHAEKKAVSLVGDLVYDYRKEIDHVREEAENKIKQLTEQMNNVNAKHLDVVIVATPEVDPVAEKEPLVDLGPVGQVETQPETQSNPIPDGESKVDTEAVQDTEAK